MGLAVLLLFIIVAPFLLVITLRRRPRFFVVMALAVGGMFTWAGVGEKVHWELVATGLTYISWGCLALWKNDLIPRANWDTPPDPIAESAEQK